MKLLVIGCLLLCFAANIKASEVIEELTKVRHIMENGENPLIDVGNIFHTTFENIGTLIKLIHGENMYSMLKDNLEDMKFNPLNVSIPCLDAAHELFTEIVTHPNQTMTLPAAKMIDAWGKIPSRVLVGNMMWIGAFDECSDLPDAKYCLTPIKLKGSPLPPISYGSCFPKNCTTKDVALVMNLFNVSIMTPLASETLCDDPVTYSTGTFITITIMALILLLCGIGTFVEIYQGYNTNNSSDMEQTDANAGINNKGFELTSRSASNGNVNDVALRSSSITPITKEGENVKVSFGINFFMCFSLLKNTKTLLSTRVAKGAITSINGIRVISMTWVILGHYYIFNILGNSPDSILKANTISQRFSFLAVANAYVSVDSFFVLSGLLVSYLTLKKIGKNGITGSNVIMMYVHRYIRLTPTLALVILFYTNVYPKLLYGPGSLVITHKEEESKKCYDYWWSTLLYINNLYPENSKNCFMLAWYLANDFQFYALSPFIMMLILAIQRMTINKMKAILTNLVIVLIMCFVSMFITGIITGYYDIPALVTSIFIPGCPRINQAKWIMDRLYVKPYVRITAYLVGMFLGYLIHNGVTLKVNRGKLISMVGWVLALILAMLVVYGPRSVFKEHGSFFTDAENIVYSACHRFVWSCAVAWVIFACHNKYGGYVNAFLSWKVWIPLSRLTYGVYLLHLMVMGYLAAVREVPLHYQDCYVVTGVVSVIVITYTLAFLLSVCVEFPITNLEKLMFER